MESSAKSPPHWLTALAVRKKGAPSVPGPKDAAAKVARKRKATELTAEELGEAKLKGKAAEKKQVVNPPKQTALKIGGNSPIKQAAATAPPSTPALAKHAVWLTGLSSDLQEAVCPPNSLASADPLSVEENRVLDRLALDGMQLSGLTQTVRLLKERYRRCSEEAAASREEKKKTHAELLKVKEDLTQLKKKSSAELKTAQDSLTALRTQLEELQILHANDSKSLSDLKITYEKAQVKIKSLKDDLEEADQAAEECRVQLGKSVAGSFYNAVEQLQLLNPKLLLNLVGLNPRAYVSHGEIIPMAAGSPSHVSTRDDQAAVGEGEEEVVNRPEPSTEIPPNPRFLMILRRNPLQMIVQPTSLSTKEPGCRL